MKLESFRPILAKLRTLLERLGAKPTVGGLQITNAGLQYVRIGAKAPETFGFRFAPGTVQDGKIVDAKQFATALAALHKAILPDKPGEIVHVAVALSAASVFTQSFEVPGVEKEKMQEAVNLNLQMISPLPADHAYMSAETLSVNADNVEMLGAFTEKESLDALRNSLLAEKFYPVAFEFPALSITRLIANAAPAKKESALLVQITSDGINLSIMRNGKMYFDYFRSWRSIQGESKQIARDVFDASVEGDIRKVVNFSATRFKESVRSAFLLAPGFEKEVGAILSERLGISSVVPQIPPGNISPVWYVAWGAALRETVETEENPFINLNYETSEDLFFEEHAISFVKLWRNIFALVFGFFLVVFAASAFYLAAQQHSLESNLVLSKNQVDQVTYQDLKQKAASFNDLVAALKGEPREVGAWHTLLERLLALAADYQVSIQRIDAPSISGSMHIIATAPDNAKTLDFKNALQKEAAFSSVDLPLASIKEASDSSVSFTVGFTVDPKKLAQ